MMDLRPYQREALQAVQEDWQNGHQKLLQVLPTGTGKTIVFSHLAAQRATHGRVLILAHRGELLEQAQDKLRQATGLPSVLEKAESSSIGSDTPVVVGSVQTMMQPSRLAKFSSDHWDTIIVDEAHHCLADSYQKILSHFDSAKVLGVTATPDRGDRKNLGQYFEKLSYEYTLPKAVQDGFLSPIRAQMIPLAIDLSNVRQQTGDFAASDLDHALEPYLEQIAAEMAATIKDRRTLVFLPLISTSQRMRDLLCQYGFRAAEVNGETHNRSEILQRFDAGEYNVLCNSMLLTEGYDSPAIDCVVVLRPTKIRSLYSQMVGRGSRLYPGKDHLLLLDFLWHTERHALCHPAHLVAADDDIAARMTAMTADGDVDIMEAEEIAERDAVEEREKALAKELSASKRRPGKLVDPLQYEMSIQAEDLVNYQPTFAWEMGPASNKQIAVLEKFGISAGSVENAGKASLLLDKLVKRSKAGLATPKQIRFLERKGFQHVGTWLFEDASKMISRISANGWKLPRGLNPAHYKPTG